MNRRVLVIAAALVTWLVAAVPAATAAPTPSEPDVGATSSAGERAVDLEPADVESAEAVERAPAASTFAKGESESGLYLIRLTDAAVPTYEGALPDFGRTAPREGERLDPDSAPVREYQEYLADQQDELVSRMEDTLGREVEVPFTYQFAVNGIAAELSADEARAVAQDRAVAAVVPDQERELHTDAGPQWIGADALWNASTDLGLPADYRGEGIVIGTIDTGISPGNRSFAETGDDGYTHENPLGEGTFLGVCDPDSSNQVFDSDFPCNDKLIGAYNFLAGQPSALDYDGHGSHTASTSGGNVVDEAVIEAPTVTMDPVPISGVAPHANVISYLGCCSVAGLTASINQAIADGVDVINYSIGSADPGDPWNDFDTIGFLNARSAGIFVATSNGNDGPGDATTGSPSSAPWITSVGAATHNRQLNNAAIGLTSSSGDLADIVGKSITGSLPSAPVVYAGDFDSPECGSGTLDNPVNDWEPGTFNGEIVVCDRGNIGRVQKSVHVFEAGGGGMILANDAPSGDSLSSDAYSVPGVHITFDDGVVLKDWLDNGADDHAGAIRGTEFQTDDAFGDIMAAFSSRGPNRAMEIIVPDVTAPGVDILAAVGADSYTVDEHGVISGTSMASPHVAGAGALLSQARPDWTPAQQQSALMTTRRDILNHDGEPATPYAQGAGMVNVDQAVRAGLLFDETIANYVDSNPAEGGDPKTLNLPSFANTQCLSTCSWDRTATAPDSAPSGVTWTASTVTDDGLDLSVSLSQDTVSPGDSVDIGVTANVADAPSGETLFGQIVLTPSDPDVPTVAMPVAVVPTAGVLPASVDVDTRRNVGSELVEGIESIEITEFTGAVQGFVPATLNESTLVQDPTNGAGQVYDDLSQVDVYQLDVPDGATRLVAEILEAEMPDADLYVGTGDTPSADTEVCASASPSSAESCDVADPQAGGWWVLVQNWAGTTPDAADAYTLATAVVPGEDLGNGGVVGPEGAVPPGEPYDIRVTWNIPEMAAGERWYGTAVLGSSPDTPGGIGSFPVTITRHDDDVTKTASVEAATVGDTVGYEIEIQPNVTSTDLVYTVTDTVPDGLTIDPDSVTGDGVVDGQTITWEADLPVPGFTYDMVTSATDETCAVPLSDDPANTGTGGYLNLLDFGVTPNPGIVGRGFWFTAFATGAPFQFWGNEYQGIDFISSGVSFFGSTPGAAFNVPQQIPDMAEPNNTLAMLWHDFEAVFDDDPFRGVSLATLGGTGPDGGVIIDYKGVEPFPAGSTSERYDFQVFAWRSVGAGPEIVFAYDNLGALDMTTTIGLEDALGENAVALLNGEGGEGVLSDGFAVCFDLTTADTDPIVLSYEVTVDADAPSGPAANAAVHTTDDPFAQPVTASTDVEISGAAISAVTVSPASARLKGADQTQQFTATGHLPDGGTVDVTEAVTWTSDDESVVTVDDSGLATSAGGGRATVTATLDDLSGTARVHVTGKPAHAGQPSPATTSTLPVVNGVEVVPV